MQFEIPKKETVSSGNKEVFESLEQSLGAVPNLYAVMAYSRFGLIRYLTFHNSASSLNIKEKTIANLIVSELNNCTYCLSDQKYIAKMNDFSEEEILQIRKGNANKLKWNALALLVKTIIENKGVVDDDVLEKFFEAGYDKENLVDVVMQVSDTISSNYLWNLSNVPVDFPLAPEMDKEMQIAKRK